MNKYTIVIIGLLAILQFCSCKKEGCIERENRLLELKFISNGQNITADYLLDSVLISTSDCASRDQSNGYGYPAEHADTALIYNLGYCDLKDSSTYIISLNSFLTRIDSFVIYMDDIDPNCLGTTIVKAKSLSLTSTIQYSNEKIIITKFQ